MSISAGTTRADSFLLSLLRNLSSLSMHFFKSLQHFVEGYAARIDFCEINHRLPTLFVVINGVHCENGGVSAKDGKRFTSGNSLNIYFHIFTKFFETDSVLRAYFCIHDTSLT